MAMSDCEKCWETPCSCGYNFKISKYSRYKAPKAMAKYIVDILGYRDADEVNLIIEMVNNMINKGDSQYESEY